MFMIIHSLRGRKKANLLIFYLLFPRSFGEYRQNEIRLARLLATLSCKDRDRTSTTAFFQNQRIPKMLCRAVRGGHRALPLKRNIRRNIKAYVPQAERHVTTDAASSHAEKEHVPAVSQAPLSKSRATDSHWCASSGRRQALRSHTF